MKGNFLISIGLIEDYVLKKEEFDEIAAYAEKIVGNSFKKKGNEIIDKDGNMYYSMAVGFYGDKKFDFAFGTATVVFNSKGTAVGFYDYYNFDSKNWTGEGSRSFFAEAATRYTANNSPKSAASYHVYFGILPVNLLNKIKNGN